MPSIDRLERRDLRAWFESGFRPSAEFGIGLEYERFGVVGTEGVPLPFDGPVSITRILRSLSERYGWEPKREECCVVELSRGTSRITLEPGLQMELSGSVHRSVDGVAEELAGYLREVAEVSRPLGVRWIAVGTHPTAALEAIPWLPKKRYEIMREYLPKRGRLAHQMMKGTCGTQVNLDYADEADAMAKLRVAMTLSAPIAALFANSPITAGKPNGRLSERTDVWLETDPDRCGVLPFALGPHATYEDYVDYALDVPMIFLVRGDRWIPMQGLPFRKFMEHGCEGQTATIEDWGLHLTTLFPDVRLKSYLELRGTDSNAPDLVLAHVALWKGLLYGGARTLERALASFPHLGAADQLRLRHDVARMGLRAQAGDRLLLDVVRELVDTASDGLVAAGAGDEPRHLDPVRELVESRGITPAEDLLARLRSAAGGVPSLLDHMARTAPVV